MIRKCDSCGKTISPAAKFQDAQYGPGMRVQNPGKGKVVCTICGKASTVSEVKKVEAKKE